MTTILDLPRDLAEEIVSRVPLKLLQQVRLACKKWNSLTKSESFRKMHIRKGAATREGESQMIVKVGWHLYLVRVFVNDLSIEFIGKLNHQVMVSQVFHFDGLLLCILKDYTKVVVWNPYWGQTRWIKTSYSHRPNGWNRMCYGFGYEDKKHCRRHKLLRFLPKFYRGASKDEVCWCEIYNFDSDLWTRLDVTPYWNMLVDSVGVYHKGNTYWLASQRNSENKGDTQIICFDFTSERFGPLMRLPVDFGNADYVTLLSCVKEEKLAVLLKHKAVNPYELDIWIATKIEAEKISWSKFLTLNMEPGYDPLSYMNFFIDEEKKVAMGIYKKKRHGFAFSIIGEGGYFKLLDLGEHAKNRDGIYGCSYVPSSVQIKQYTKGKKKQRNDLETRRFDKNMWRLGLLEERIRLRHTNQGTKRKRS